MKMVFRVTVVALLYFIAMGGIGFAQTTPETLAKAIVDAINAQDMDQFKGLHHPKTVQQFDVEAPEELTKKMAHHLGKAPIGEYQVSTLSFEEALVSMAKSGMTFDAETQTFSIFGTRKKVAVEPSESLSILFTKEGKGLVLGFYIGELDGKWYIIEGATVK